MAEWISVKDRLPDNDVLDEFLVVVKEKYHWEKEWRYHIDTAMNHGDYIDNYWDTRNDWNEGQEVHITHWMPFPRTPKERGGEK